MALVIAEIGINHDGDMFKARRMLRDVAASGCKVAKFQCHVVEDEYVPCAREIVPSNANENIYDMMQRCSFTEAQERSLKHYAEELGLEYLSTPFSRAAVDRLERIGVNAYKIGSGECNNYPLVKYIASKGKPVILSTGMNSMLEIDKTVGILGKSLVAILHCVSMYPTPYDAVNLPRMLELKERYHVPVGLSDHSIGIYTALAAVALGASVVEKHFTSDKTWPGADVPISIGVEELRSLVVGCGAITKGMGRTSNPFPGGQTALFAFASVVAIRDIYPGDKFTGDNLWVKRPGTGITAEYYESILGSVATRYIPKDIQLTWSDIA